MLFAESTKYGAGIELFGDYLDLKSLQELIYDLVEGYPIGGGESHLGEFVLGLAYEVRHAHQGDRENREVGLVGMDVNTYHGFTALWPYFLPQIALLRCSASYHATSRHHQSLLFKLEGCIEDTLNSTEPRVAKEVMNWLFSFSCFQQDYYIQYLDDLALFYVTAAKSRKARIRLLPRVLHMMEPWSESYRKFAAQLEAEANRHKCQPHELQSVIEWPEFKE